MNNDVKPGGKLRKLWQTMLKLFYWLGSLGEWCLDQLSPWQTQMLEEPDYSIFSSGKRICFYAFLCQIGDNEVFPVMFPKSLSPWQILTFPLLILLKFRNNQGRSGQATEIAGEFGHFYTGHSLVAWKEWWLLYANIPKWFSHSSSSYCSSILLRVKDEWIKVVKHDILACIASVNYGVMHLTDYLSTVYFLFHTLLKSCSVIKHVRFGP